MRAQLASIMLISCCGAALPLRGGPAKFSAEFTLSGGPNEALVSVFETDGDAKKLFWSRNVPYPGAQARQFFASIPRHILVSEEGQHVVVRSTRQTGSDDAWLFVSREKEAVRIPLSTFESLIAAKLAADRGFYSPGPVGILNLLQKGRYHAWFPGPNKWVSVDLTAPKLNPAIADAETTAELNRWAKDLALRRVQKHQPGALGRLIKPLRAKAAEHLPGFDRPQAQNAGSDDELLASYAFLTVQKEPEAEKYIQGLLAMPMPEGSPGFYLFDDRSVTVLLRNMDRHLGDRLWDWWNRSTNGQAGLQLDAPNHAQFRDGNKLRYLSEIRGEVKLPFPFPEKAGSVWIYLIPETTPENQWHEAPDVIALCVDVFPGILAPRQAEIEQLHFRLATIAPGKYRLKAVWDRRPPHASRNERVIPGPGDYESAETAAFQVTAGEIVSARNLECTNRLAGADEYYAADQTWARLAPTREDQIVREWVGPLLANARHLLYEAPVLTNNAPKIPPFRLIRAATVDTKTGIDLEAAYILASREGWIYPNFQVRDEHGCTFKPRSVEPKGLPGRRQLLFAPRFAMRPRPGAYELIADSTPIAAGLPALTNLVVLPSVLQRSIEPESLPARRTIGGIVFELASIDRNDGPRLRVLDESGSWMHESTEIIDSHGHTGPNFDEFCRREELFIVRATFAPLLQQPPIEQTWHVPVGDWPKEGEFHPIGLATNIDGVKFEILTVGGKGSFSYRNGRVLESSAELRGWDDGAWPSLPSVADFVRLKPANHRDPVHRDELIVRLPHVALRVTGLRPEHRFRLAEEREKPWRSLRDLESGDLPATEPWYLPLNRETRARTGGLTIELTKAVTVEFAVRVPPAEAKSASVQ